MIKKPLPTSYAPAERASEEEIKKQHSKIASNKDIKKILEAVPEAVLILNKERQIVFVNTVTLQLLKIKSADLICGLRPGEAFDCTHAKETEGGCGTTRFCRYCGAVNSILASQGGEVSIKECRISQYDGNALDLKVKASPFYDEDNEFYTVFSINDISDEKRKQALEKIFFHDILNTAGALSGYSELLIDADPDENIDCYKDAVYQLSQEIIEELRTQKQLIAAENGELTVAPTLINSYETLNKMVVFYQKHEVAEGKTVLQDDDSESVKFQSDAALLSRVLGNMIKNALESSDKGKTVRVGCRKKEDHIEFWVNNHKVMPEAVRMQVFQRSFSTKGPGRGLGTYSIKLLTERYLKGSVSFDSTEGKGTTFTICHPITLNT